MSGGLRKVPQERVKAHLGAAQVGMKKKGIPTKKRKTLLSFKEGMTQTAEQKRNRKEGDGCS